MATLPYYWFRPTGLLKYSRLVLTDVFSGWYRGLVRILACEEPEFKRISGEWLHTGNQIQPLRSHYSLIILSPDFNHVLTRIPSYQVLLNCKQVRNAYCVVLACKLVMQYFNFQVSRIHGKWKRDGNGKQEQELPVENA